MGGSRCGREFHNPGQALWQQNNHSNRRSRLTVSVPAFRASWLSIYGVRASTNIAAGPQQVNNVPTVPEGSRARGGNSESAPIKLLEEPRHVERVDTGTAAAAGSRDHALETVAAVNGTADGGRVRPVALGTHFPERIASSSVPWRVNSTFCFARTREP
jgi:hypothetical protein